MARKSKMTLSELKELNEEVYELAIANTREDRGKHTLKMLVEVDEEVYGCFDFSTAKEHQDFWAVVVGWRGDEAREELFKNYQ